MFSYGILRGAMAPGLTRLLFALPDGGFVGAMPGIVFGCLAFLVKRLRSRVAALGLLIETSIMAFDNLIYHYLPIGLLPLMMAFWISVRSLKAAIAWHQDKRSVPETGIGIQSNWRSRLNQATWYAVLGALFILVGFQYILQATILEWKMRGSITAPCEIIGKHEIPSSKVLGGVISYGVSCKFLDLHGTEQTTNGIIPKDKWNALQTHGQIWVQYQTSPPYYKRVYLNSYDWLWSFTFWVLVTVGGVILVTRGLSRTKDGGDGTVSASKFESPQPAK